MLEFENADMQDEIDANIGDIDILQAMIDDNKALIASLQMTVSNLTTLQDQIDNNNALISALQQEIAQINNLLDLKQMIVNGNCPAGQSIRQINDDGSVVCEIDDSGSTGAHDFVTVINSQSVPTNGSNHGLSIKCPLHFKPVGAGYEAGAHHNVFRSRPAGPFTFGQLGWLFTAQASGTPGTIVGWVMCMNLSHQ